MPDPYARPFVCSGSPLACRVFVVGLNAATRLNQPFWEFWSDATGFDRDAFMKRYDELRPKSGARPRIERIVNEMPRGVCLETNLFCIPTKKAADLRREHRKPDVFEYLFDAIKPAVVYVHSNAPIEFFRARTGCGDFNTAVRSVVWKEHQFRLFGTPGPIWRMSLENAQAIGRILANEATRSQ